MNRDRALCPREASTEFAAMKAAAVESAMKRASAYPGGRWRGQYERQHCHEREAHYPPSHRAPPNVEVLGV